MCKHFSCPSSSSSSAKQRERVTNLMASVIHVATPPSMATVHSNGINSTTWISIIDDDNEPNRTSIASASASSSSKIIQHSRVSKFALSLSHQSIAFFIILGFSNSACFICFLVAINAKTFKWSVMNIAALLTSAGINIAVCVVLLSLYSVLRKQPGYAGVYFGRRLVQERIRRNDPFCFDQFLPSPSWIAKAWTTTDEEIMAIGGLDAVAFLRILVFSMRIFSIAAIICVFLVLPLNYFGQEMIHKQIPSESLEVFTIANVQEGSKWVWVHCLALYIISLSALILLYFEYRSISRMRLAQITKSPPNPSHFTILVRAIPWTVDESYSNSVKNFFTNYHGSSYLSHQMVYRSGTVHKIMNDAEKMCRKLSHFASTSMEHSCRPMLRCGLCGVPPNSFKKLSEDSVHVEVKPTLKHCESGMLQQECAAAFVFFKTRYAAVIASQGLQSSNPMLWVTDLAPEPHDVYWSNLWIPYRQLWIRRIGTLLAALVFVFLFLIPVTFVQGLSQLDQLQQKLPFMKGILKKQYINQLVTGYLPSVILMLFLYTVPPLMMLFSAVEGSISRSDRKKSACYKILYFMIWNVFFVNVLSGSAINALGSAINIISSPEDIPTLLAKAVPRQATFFTTYVLTSGWASLSSEVMQPFALICNLVNRFILLRSDTSPGYALSFPYHTEVPKLLLFGLIGFSCSILAPLILPFLLVYFFLAYIVYRNQILNVYISKYESHGQIWPIVHNTTIFSLVLAQIIALGVFGIKQSPVASGFTIPLVILTILFSEYCRKRFLPIFKNFSAQDLIEMDRQDEQSGRMEEIYSQLNTAYCQFSISHEICIAEDSSHSTPDEDIKPGLAYPTLGSLSVNGMQQLVTWLSMLSFQERNQPV